MACAHRMSMNSLYTSRTTALYDEPHPRHPSPSMKSFALAAALSLTALTANAANPTPVDLHGALHVEGSRLLDQNGKPVALAGPSFFWSNTDWGQEKFYNASAVK